MNDKFTKEQNTLLVLIRTAINGVGGELPQYEDSKLVTLSIEQGVAPVVLAGAQWYKDNLDRKVLGTQAVLTLYAMTQKQQRQTERTRRLCEDFIQWLGMPCVVMKGIDYARLWPDETWRGFGDLDIWLLGKYDEGNKRAREIGCYVKAGGHYKHSEICYNGLNIENHQYMTVHDDTKNGKFLEKELQRLVATNYTSVTDFMLFPCREFTAIFMLVHAHQHFFFEGFTLRMVLDWFFFLKKEGQNVKWDVVLPVLEKAGIRGFYDVMTEFCVRYLGLMTTISYIDNPKLVERFLKELFAGEAEGGKALQLLRRFRRMWRFHQFLGTNIVIRIKNTLVYNYLHHQPELD